MMSMFKNDLPLGASAVNEFVLPSCKCSEII